MGAGTCAPMLPEREAFEIATAWLDELQDRLQLSELREDHSHSLAGSYWAVLFFPLESEETTPPDSPNASARTREAASLVRAATLTWYMLSRCAGYSQTQAIFWKTVFDDYQQDITARMGGYRTNLTVSQSFGFFDKPGSIFPHVVVSPASENEALFKLSLGTLLGTPGYEMDCAIADKLQTLVARMAPYFYEPRGDRAIVKVDVMLSIAKSTPLLASVPVVFGELALAQIKIATPDSYTPRMQISEVYYETRRRYTTTAHVAEMYALTQRLPFHFESDMGVWEPAERLPTASQALWVSSVLRLPNHNIQAITTSLHFPVNYKHDDLFRAFMSALPFASGLHTVKIQSQRMVPRAFEDHDLVWIAYAIHHPNAIHSSWRHLFVTSFQPSPRVTQVLTAMARGNNLLQLLNGSPADAISYVRGKLAPRTVVRMAPDVTSPTLLVTPASERVGVDVCGVNSARVAAWGLWVAVVVPAYGIGYVRPAQVQDITECPASPSRLTGLSLWSTIDRESPAIIATLLSFIGEQLEYLNVLLFVALDSSMMGRIFQSCPNLRRLNVSHNGAYWSEVLPNVDLSTHTQLEELSLAIPYVHVRGRVLEAPGTAYLCEPCIEHLETSLAKLRVFILRGYSQSLEFDCRPIVAGILRYATQLEKLHVCKEVLINRNKPKTYKRELARSETTVLYLGLDESHFPLHVTRLKLPCVLAFLSLSTAELPSKSSTLAQICGDRALSSRIIQFVSSTQPRTIYFEV